MATPEDIEGRVAALEAAVADLRERLRHSEHDAAAARGLAGGVARDVSELRTEIRGLRQATTSTLTAMRTDLTDLRTQVNDGFTEIRGRLDATAAGQEQIVGLLNTLIAGHGDQPADR